MFERFVTFKTRSLQTTEPEILDLRALPEHKTTNTSDRIKINCRMVCGDSVCTSSRLILFTYWHCLHTFNQQQSGAHVILTVKTKNMKDQLVAVLVAAYGCFKPKSVCL